MRPIQLTAMALSAFAAAGLSACSGGVEASGCFASSDLAEGRQVGVRIHNACDVTASCVLEVAYRCDEVQGPLLSATFTLQPSGDSEQWLEIPCTGAYRYAVAWQCSDEGVPEVADPSI